MLASRLHEHHLTVQAPPLTVQVLVAAGLSLGCCSRPGDKATSVSYTHLTLPTT